nr:hypothetical protein [Tanacetum cinerariifolium]GEZ29806.1 hypothetical protein [Tanacetum cinerariifolium]
MHGQVDWVLYKESILLRFGQNKEFMSYNVKDSICGLHVIDKVGDLLVNNNHCEVNLGRSECAHKMFDEKSIKEILKQDIITEYSDAYVRESIEVGKKIVENVVVETAKVDVEVGNECNLLSSDISCLQQEELSSLAVRTSSGSENSSGQTVGTKT